MKVFFSGRKESESYFLVDETDYHWVTTGKWYLSKKGYVYNRGGKLLHRMLMLPPINRVVDHINHNKLDNRRCNLRVCTQQENSNNRLVSKNNKSGHTGVSSFRNGWRVFYGKDYLGTFSSLQEAIITRERRATRQ